MSSHPRFSDPFESYADICPTFVYIVASTMGAVIGSCYINNWFLNYRQRGWRKLFACRPLFHNIDTFFSKMWFLINKAKTPTENIFHIYIPLWNKRRPCKTKQITAGYNRFFSWLSETFYIHIQDVRLHNAKNSMK